MLYAFGGSCFGKHYVHSLAKRYVLQTRGLDLIVESGTGCLQLIVCLEIVMLLATFANTKNKRKN